VPLADSLKETPIFQAEFYFFVQISRVGIENYSTEDQGFTIVEEVIFSR
jgi:hypothetical protein